MKTIPNTPIKLGEQIKQRRKEMGIGMQKAAAFLGCCSGGLEKYEKEAMYPDAYMLVKLCAFFNIPLQPYRDMLYPDTIAGNMQYLRLIFCYSQEEIGEYLGVGAHAIYTFEADIYSISEERLDKLAELYHVSLEYFRKREDTCYGEQQIAKMIEDKMNNPFMETSAGSVGSRLKKARKKANISWAEVQKALGKCASKNWLYTYESNAYLPTPKQLLQLSRYYNVKVTSIIPKTIERRLEVLMNSRGITIEELMWQTKMTRNQLQRILVTHKEVASPEQAEKIYRALRLRPSDINKFNNMLNEEIKGA